MTEPQVLPIRLEVHPRLRQIELRRVIGTGLGALLIGGGMLAATLYLAYHAGSLAIRFRSGVTATQATLVEWSTRRKLVARLSGTVAYRDAIGKIHQHQLSSYRVLVAPEPTDPVSVRYAKEDPSSAVTSWEYGSVPHELALACVTAFLAAIVLRGSMKEVRASLDRMALSRELSEDGKLAPVDLLESRREEGGFRVMLLYRYRTTRGVELTGSIAVAEGGAYRLDESGDQSLAMLSQDEQRGLLLSRSGYPLMNLREHLPTL